MQMFDNYNTNCILIFIHENIIMHLSSCAECYRSHSFSPAAVDVQVQQQYCNTHPVCWGWAVGGRYSIASKGGDSV